MTTQREIELLTQAKKNLIKRRSLCICNSLGLAMWKGNPDDYRLYKINQNSTFHKIMSPLFSIAKKYYGNKLNFVDNRTYKAISMDYSHWLNISDTKTRIKIINKRIEILTKRLKEK